MPTVLGSRPRHFIRPAPIRASVAVTSYASDPGAVESDAPYAVGAQTGFIPAARASHAADA